MNYNSLSDSNPSRLTLIMPVLNEGVRVIPVITTLAYTVNVPLNILIIYDKDSDPTIDVINGFKDIFPNIHLIKNEGPRLVGAIKTGISHASTDILGIWVPYHVDPYGLINKMYQLSCMGCVVVSGNRFNKVKRVTRGGMIKKLLSRGGNYILNRIIKMPFGDITTSIKFYHKSFLSDNPFETTINGGWAISTELAIKATIQGVKVGEVEFLPENTNIITGVSNFKVFRQLGQYVKWLHLGWTNRKRIRENYKNGQNIIQL